MTSRRIEGWDAGSPEPWVVGYIVGVRNTLTEELASVKFLSGRQGLGVALIDGGRLTPATGVVVPVGTVADLLGYEIAAFDVQGHMVMRLPATGTITQAEAASALPTRPNSHTDYWDLKPEHMLPMTQPYTVTLLNKTPDVWDEVTVFYSSAIEGTVGFSSSAVDPEGHVTFDLGPAGAMDGYVFAIWVDGLRAYLAPDTLQFPAEGLMTSRRAAETKREFHANSDTWTIGADA